jgi:hypothetical protein
MSPLDPDKSPTAGRHRRHVWIDDDDWDWICMTFEGKMTPSHAIRTILKKFRKGIESRVELSSKRPSVEP